MIANDFPGAMNQPGIRDEWLRQDPFWFILRALRETDMQFKSACQLPGKTATAEAESRANPGDKAANPVTERWMSGLSRTPGKRVWDNIPTGVRIPLSPPSIW
jgi:hypothetical protein